MESIERRAFLLVLAVAIVLAFDNPNYVFTTQAGKGWQVFVFILGLFALAVAAVALALATAPATVAEFAPERRESFLFVALALVVVAMLTMVLLRAYSTYHLHRSGLPV
jgi:hypothetical protein